jgi:threonine/homoserine/homoserine lactone efflux protein
MRLSQPKVITWWIAVILAVVGLVGELGVIPALADVGFWLVLIAFVLLAVANLVRGL